MTGIEDVKNNLLNLTNIEKHTIENQIVAAFKDFQFNGETELILNNYNNNNAIIAYINDIDSPIFTVNFLENNDLYYCNSVSITYTNVNINCLEA